jgi:hypothetical protein
MLEVGIDVLRPISPVEKIFRETLPGVVPGYEVREQQIQMACRDRKI